MIKILAKGMMVTLYALDSIYLIVEDFEKSIAFYDKLLEMHVTCWNMDRFAQFIKRANLMNK